MTREEQIREASINYQLSINPRAIGGDAFSDFAREMNVNPSFIAGAKWADETMIEKACKWLLENAGTLIEGVSDASRSLTCELFVSSFKKEMKK